MVGLAVLIALSMAGCGKKVPSKFIGTWHEVLPNASEGDATFGKDDSYRFVSASSARAPKVVVTGVYREDGDLMFLTIENVRIENLPPNLKSQEKEMLDKMKDTLDVGTENSANVTWSGPNAFVSVSSDGRQASFTRE